MTTGIQGLNFLLHPDFSPHSAATASPPNHPGDGRLLSVSESRLPQGDQLIPRVNNAGGIVALAPCCERRHGLRNPCLKTLRNVGTGPGVCCFPGTPCSAKGKKKNNTKYTAKITTKITLVNGSPGAAATCCRWHESPLCPRSLDCARAGRHFCKPGSSHCGRCLHALVENSHGRCVVRKRHTSHSAHAMKGKYGLRLTQKVDYPVNGLMRSQTFNSLPGDKKLAHSAQMYHYQHQKQQMLSLEKVPNSGATTDEENEDGDFTVYECPGLAPVKTLDESLSGKPLCGPSLQPSPTVDEQVIL
uniref:Neural proliferation, differentiation and control, 1b n=1 Tax=Mola mola TaxID=94237 RepID=A0A3Q3WAB4_MOLML